MKAGRRMVLWSLVVVATSLLVFGCGGGGGGPVATTGSMNVSSSPSGARIWLDAVDTAQVTPTTLSGVTAGGHTVKLVLSGYLDWQGSVTVTAGQTATLSPALTPGVLTSIQVSPNNSEDDPLNMAAGSQLQFTAQGYDQDGHPMSATIAWSPTGSIGSVNQAGLLTATQATTSADPVTGTVVATSGTVSASVNVAIVPGSVDAIVISYPEGVDLAHVQVGDTIQFSAVGEDQYGNRGKGMRIAITPTWSVTGGIGTIDTNGLFTATQAGGGQVVATLAEPLLTQNVGVTVVSSGGGGLADTPWPKFRANAKNTGLSPYVGAQTGAEKWAFQTGGDACFSPAIGADGTVYVGSDDLRLNAVNPDGTQKWGFQTGGYVSCPAIGAEGIIYAGSSDYYLYALNPDGTQKWRFLTGNPVGSSPAIGADGTVYVGSYDGHLYALNPDGTQKWRFLIGGYVQSSPAIGSDGTVYVGSGDDYLYAINPDGTQKWRFLTGYWVSSSPAIGADGTVYVGSVDNYLYAIKPDGTQKWRFQTGGEVWSSPAIGGDGTVYVGSDDDYLYAVNPDGTQKWRFQTGYMVESSPAVGADGRIYVGSNDNYLYGINSDGTLKWRFHTGGRMYSSSPAIGGDGTVYVGSWDGYLYAIGP